MAHEAYKRRQRERRPEGSSESEEVPVPSLPEAKPNECGVLVSNEFWRKYMRRYDTWVGEDE